MKRGSRVVPGSRVRFAFAALVRWRDRVACDTSFEGKDKAEADTKNTRAVHLNLDFRHYCKRIYLDLRNANAVSKPNTLLRRLTDRWSRDPRPLATSTYEIFVLIDVWWMLRIGMKSALWETYFGAYYRRYFSNPSNARRARVLGLERLYSQRRTVSVLMPSSPAIASCVNSKLSRRARISSGVQTFRAAFSRGFGAIQPTPDIL